MSQHSSPLRWLPHRDRISRDSWGPHKGAATGPGPVNTNNNWSWLGEPTLQHLTSHCNQGCIASGTYMQLQHLFRLSKQMQRHSAHSPSPTMSPKPAWPGTCLFLRKCSAKTHTHGNWKVFLVVHALSSYIYIYIHTWEGRGRKPATVKDINMVIGGECENPGELPTSFPITSSPTMPILHMNSHSIFGALLRLVNRSLHRKKGTPKQLKACPLHSVPSLFSMNGSHRFLQSLFSFHVLLHYACLVHMNSTPYGAPFWVRQLDLFTVKKRHPQAIQNLPAAFCSLSCPPQRTTASHELAPRMGCPFAYSWQASSPLNYTSIDPDS